MLKDFEIVCEEKEKSQRLSPRFYLSGKTPGGDNCPTLYVDPRDGKDPICLLVVDYGGKGETWLWCQYTTDRERLKAIGLTLRDDKIAVS